MLDPNERTPEEMADLLAVVNRRYVRMIRPGDGRTVTVVPERVQERLAAGYTIKENES